MPRDHIVLVPGFGGFDALGSLRYYHGVTDILRSTQLIIHYFPNLPTASVLSRACQLKEWLVERQLRREIGDDDNLHLVGHSTGGLDIRQLLIDLRDVEESGSSDNARGLIDRIRSVQFLSTPHRGSNLAHHLGQTWLRSLLSRGLLGTSYGVARLMGEQGVGAMGKLLRRWLPDDRLPDWMDAIIDTMAGCYSTEGPVEQATARASYFDLLKWMAQILSDEAAVTDLDPEPHPGAPPSPAHRDDFADEQEFIDRHGIRVGSIVTVSSPRSDERAAALNVFRITYNLTAYKPTQRLRLEYAIPKLLVPGEEIQLGPSENDGIVNSVSMVWPDASSCYAVEADHGDVIGHFQGSPKPEPGCPCGDRQYDLLSSASRFDAAQFQELWTRIAAFTEGKTYQPRHQGPKHPRSRAPRTSRSPAVH